MFGTGHPRPLHRKEVPMHVLRQEERRLDSRTLTVDVPDKPEVAVPPAAQAIRFEVAYTLSEYLGFLRDHLSFTLRHAQKPMRLRRIGIPLACACITLIGIPIFLVKKRRMPHCAFRIDAAGIERSTRAGTLVRSWADIEGVRRYRRGFLVLVDRGGDADSVPVPGSGPGGHVPSPGSACRRNLILRQPNQR